MGRWGYPFSQHGCEGTRARGLSVVVGSDQGALMDATLSSCMHACMPIVNLIPSSPHPLIQLALTWSSRILLLLLPSSSLHRIPSHTILLSRPQKHAGGGGRTTFPLPLIHPHHSPPQKRHTTLPKQKTKFNQTKLQKRRANPAHLRKRKRHAYTMGKRKEKQGQEERMRRTRVSERKMKRSGRAKIWLGKTMMRKRG